MTDLTVKQCAIVYQDVLYTLPRPARHCDIIAEINKNLVNRKAPKIGMVQGFLLSNDQFADRVESAKAALASGQIEKLKFQKHQLFSEDLW